jgi:hypothetical protein
MSVRDTHPLTMIETHDARYTHGYLAGYCQAKIEIREGFERDVPTSQVPDLVNLLTGGGADIDVSVPETGRYGVPWCHLRVAFPAAQATRRLGEELLYLHEDQ